MTRRPSADRNKPPAKHATADRFTTDASIEPTQVLGAAYSGSENDLSGQSLGSYEIIGKLGEGGMGTVYKARHGRLDKLMALKILPQHLVRNSDAVKRFEREMRALGKMEHPHLVQAHDAGEDRGIHYLALELVEGGDLTRLVKKRGTLAIWLACRLIRQAALALDYAHQQGLVHRDIKPANLMLTRSGHLKVSDLGLARLVQDDGATEVLTSTGMCMGTPDYMAPEQWDNSHTVDGRADLYALGCTLFYLLVGRAPWQTEECGTMPSKLKAHVMGELPDLKAIRPDTPEPLVAIYCKLLSKRPADRYASGGELAEALLPLTDKSAATKTAGSAAPREDQPAKATAAATPRTELTEVLAALPNPTARAAKRRHAVNAKPRPADGRGRRTGLRLAVGGGFFLLLLGIIIKITNPDGTTTEIEVAEGAKVEIIQREGQSPEQSVMQDFDDTMPPKPPEETATERSDLDAVDAIERQVARWALDQGAHVKAWSHNTSGAPEQLHLMPGMPFPQQRFNIYLINFKAGVTINDGDLRRLERLPRLKSFHFTGKSPDMAQLLKLTNLQRLSGFAFGKPLKDLTPLRRLIRLNTLSFYSDLTPKNLDAITHCRRLQAIKFGSTLKDPRESLQALASSQSLRTIYLEQPAPDITEEIVERIQSMNANLRVIAQTQDGYRCIGRDPVREAALALIAAGVQFQIRDTPIGPPARPASASEVALPTPFQVMDIMIPETAEVTEEMLAVLAQSNPLYSVSIRSKGSVTPLLSALSEQYGVESMNLGGATLDEDSLAILETMDWLAKLYIVDTKLSESQVESLKNSLRYTEIASDFGTFPPLADEDG